MIIRIPKLRVLKNKSLAPKTVIFNLADLEKKSKSDIITKESLLKERLIRNPKFNVKILAKSGISRPLTIKGITVSKKAKELIEAKGGKIIA